MEVNINDRVKVKLTDLGIDIMRRKHVELQALMPEKARRPFEEPELVDGYYKTQLWVLMETFGGHISMGGKLPFETEIILEDPSTTKQSD